MLYSHFKDEVSEAQKVRVNLSTVMQLVNRAIRIGWLQYPYFPHHTMLIICVYVIYNC